MEKKPTVQMYMARVLRTIEAGATLEEAEKAMAAHGVRHLPVLREGVVVGILSDRDAKLAAGIMGEDARSLPVLDVCTGKPYTVDCETPLADVVATMAAKAYGSALVTEKGKLAGIFTTVDACRVLADVLRLKF